MDKKTFSELYGAAKAAGTTACGGFGPFGYVIDNAVKVATPEDITVCGERIRLRCDIWEYFLGEDGLEDFGDVPGLETIVTDLLMSALHADSSTNEAFDAWKRTNRPAYIVSTPNTDRMFLTLHEARCHANACLLTNHYVTVEKVNWTRARKAQLKDYEDAVDSFLEDESSVVMGAGVTFQPYSAIVGSLVYTGVCTGIGMIAALTEESFREDWCKAFPEYRIDGTGPDGKGKVSYSVFVQSETDEDGNDDIEARLDALRIECALTDPVITKL